MCLYSSFGHSKSDHTLSTLLPVWSTWQGLVLMLLFLQKVLDLRLRMTLLGGLDVFREAESFPLLLPLPPLLLPPPPILTHFAQFPVCHLATRDHRPIA